MSTKMFPTNSEIKELGKEFYASWGIEKLESSCINCGTEPELIETKNNDYTICPNGCFIAI